MNSEHGAPYSIGPTAQRLRVRVCLENDRLKIQEGLAVASIARDDPSPLPGMHRDHNTLLSQTDRRTLRSWHKREMYITSRAKNSDVQ